MPIIEFKSKESFRAWLPESIRCYEVDASEVIHYFNPQRKKFEIEKAKAGRDALAIEVEKRGFNYEALERKGDLFFTCLFANVKGRITMLGVFAEYPKGSLWWPIGRRAT